MQNIIAQQIRKFRKERRLTQEQLAAALGVTVGAVSKWESGATTPDISLIMDLAAFFETSVDVLLGYMQQSGGAQKTVEEIKLLRNAKDFAAASAAAEKALQKYPNSFQVTFASAIQYAMRGIETSENKFHRRAQELFERALELIGQNEDPRTNAWTINNRIASCQKALGQTDKALETMKNNNADGLNDGSIGFTLATTAHKPDEALPYLASALVSYVTRMAGVVTGYFNAYVDKKDYENALRVMLWMRDMLDGLREVGRLSYMDCMSIQVRTACAAAADLLGRREEALCHLAEATAEAERFDRAPVYTFSGMRFFHGKDMLTAFDEFGHSSKAGIRHMLEDMDVSDGLLAAARKA